MNEPIPQLLAEMTTAQLVFLGGLILLVGILITRSRSYFARKAWESRRAQTAAAAPTAHASHKPAEIERWEVQMEEFARELSARLDNKMQALEHLIRDAEVAAARLHAAIDAEARPEKFDEPGAAPETSKRAGRGETSHPAGTFHDAYAPSSGDDPRYRKIYALADQGLSRDVIARRVGAPAGEVDLILSLRRQK